VIQALFTLLFDAKTWQLDENSYCIRVYCTVSGLMMMLYFTYLLTYLSASG